MRRQQLAGHTFWLGREEAPHQTRCVLLIAEPPIPFPISEEFDASSWIVRAHTPAHGVRQDGAEEAYSSRGRSASAGDTSQPSLLRLSASCGAPFGNVMQEAVDVVSRESAHPPGCREAA